MNNCSNFSVGFSRQLKQMHEVLVSLYVFKILELGPGVSGDKECH